MAASPCRNREPMPCRSLSMVRNWPAFRCVLCGHPRQRRLRRGGGAFLNAMPRPTRIAPRKMSGAGPGGSRPPPVWASPCMWLTLADGPTGGADGAGVTTTAADGLGVATTTVTTTVPCIFGGRGRRPDVVPRKAGTGGYVGHGRTETPARSRGAVDHLGLGGRERLERSPQREHRKERRKDEGCRSAHAMPYRTHVTLHRLP